MSNERFDQLMKKNLESVRLGYQPGAWTRFSKRLPLGFWTKLLPYGGWVLSAIILTGWLTTLYTLHTNQQVIKQLTKTLAVQTDSVNLTPAQRTPSLSTHQVDTVYVVQRTVVEHRYARERQADRWSADNPSTEHEPLQLNQHDPIRVVKPRQPALLPKRDSVTDSVNRVIAGAKATFPVDLNQVLKDHFPLVDTDKTTQPPASLSATTSVPVAQPAVQRRSPFRLSSLQPRVGLEIGATLNGLGVGAAIEFFPTENLGVSVGVQASQLQREEHKELRDFNAATGTEFIEKYRAFLPAQYDQIRDISVRTSLISLPVLLTYYLPLRRNWSLLFQSGTNLDIAAYQQVRYKSYYRGNDQFHSFETDAGPRFFHNFMFGAGVQYHRPRMAAQLSPYYLNDFRGLVNMSAGSSIGIKASIWLNLFKP